jgi:hypothetical protein
MELHLVRLPPAERAQNQQQNLGLFRPHLKDRESRLADVPFHCTMPTRLTSSKSMSSKAGSNRKRLKRQDTNRRELTNFGDWSQVSASRAGRLGVPGKTTEIWGRMNLLIRCELTVFSARERESWAASQTFKRWGDNGVDVRQGLLGLNQ